MTVMTHKRLVSAFTKAGCVVTNGPEWDQNRKGPSKTWVAKNPKNGKYVTWYVQDGFNPETKTWDASNPVTVSVCRPSKDTDAMTDCFCDSFYRSIKSAVAAIA